MQLFIFLLCKFFRSQKHVVGILFWLCVSHPLHHSLTLDWHVVDPHPIQSQRPHTRDASTIRWLLKQLSHSSTYRLIIQSNGAVVKPGYSALYSRCAFFLYRGYFIIRPVILTPYQKKLPVLFYKPGAPGVTMVPHHAYHS